MKVFPSTLQGSIDIPASKSHTMRAILFASLAKGQSKIKNILVSPDTKAMMKACQSFGAKMIISDETLWITGVAGRPIFNQSTIDAGNSGQVLRFIGAIAGLCEQEVLITGDESIKTQRPVVELLSGLNQFGCHAKTVNGTNFAPIVIQGPFQHTYAKISGQDSQPVSALLIARAFALQPSIIEVSHPGEKPWILLTLDWFKRLGISYVNEDFCRYVLNGNAEIEAFDYTVPGDFSSCAFPLVAALITQSEITLNHLDMNDIQGDKMLIEALRMMGANIQVLAAEKKIKVLLSDTLHGTSIDVNPMIDAVPILAVLACFMTGTTIINGAEIAKSKESNRLRVMCQELKKLGANIEETSDGLRIQRSHLHSASVFSHHDHRVAMALAIAGLRVPGGIEIQEDGCIAKSFPFFKEKMLKLGVRIV